MKLTLIFAFFTILLTGCNEVEKIILSAKCENGLSVEAKVHPIVKDFKFYENFTLTSELLHIEGNLVFHNKTNNLLKISNKNISLTGDGFLSEVAHTYSLSAGPQDFGSVKVKPNERLESKVYWVVNLQKESKAQKLQVLCKI